MPSRAYAAAAVVRGHHEGPGEQCVTTRKMLRWVKFVRQLWRERASINIYLVYLFSLALGLCVWREIHEERMLSVSFCWISIPEVTKCQFNWSMEKKNHFGSVRH